MIQRICVMLVMLTPVIVAGCGGPAKRSMVPRPAIEADYAALRWVPPTAEFVVASRELVAVIETLAGNLPQEVQRVVGDTGRVETWTQMGIDTSQGGAVFGSTSAVTVVLPIASKPNLDALWSRVRPELNVTSQTHRGYELFEGSTLVIPGSWWWLQLDGWLVVRWSPNAEDGISWLDPLLDAAATKSYGSSPSIAAALGLGKKLQDSALPDLLGAVAPSLGLDAVLPPELASLRCAGIVTGLRDVHLAANIGTKGVEAIFGLELDSEASDSLRQLLAPSPSPGMVSFRDTAGIYASIGIDVTATAAALSRAGCSALADDLEDPLASIGWSPPPRSFHLAAADLRLRDYKGDVALEASIRDRRFINGLLDMVPMRSLLESTIRVAGQKAKVISVPGSPSVYYQLSKDRLVASAGKKRLSKIVTRATEDSEELVALGLRSIRLGDLGSFLRPFLRSTSPALQRGIRELLAFKSSSLRLWLKGRRLQLRLELLW